ncbi:MAG: hypothetical protein HY826_12825 [Actinobacteria bacterium]|nr:hypothetical protein [Actinomycetota bacterium]
MKIRSSRRPWQWLLSLAVVAFTDARLGATPQVGQQDPQLLLIKAWVDPVFGVDPVVPSTGFDRINDEGQPFRTLQRAMDVCQIFLDQQYQSDPAMYETTQAIVYALPGLYGQHAQGSGDAFPIRMRDRVHLQGVNSRTCIIRGGFSTKIPVIWPDQERVGISGYPAEVLVDFSESTKWSPLPFPAVGGISWSPIAVDVPEMLDGFTFQGGDVQVLFQSDQKFNVASSFVELQGRVSNCVFDMRHNWRDRLADSVIAGPFFGVLMAKHWFDMTDGFSGYVDQPIVIHNNTFIMAQWGKPLEGGNRQWVNDSRRDAVGIIDCTYPGCDKWPVAKRDVDLYVRGVGNPMIFNNLFRTRPVPAGGSWATKPMAMLGIDAGDTGVRVNGTGPFRQTNVFAPGRVGANNAASGSATFFSMAVSGVTFAFFPGATYPLLDCSHIGSMNDCFVLPMGPDCSPAPALPSPAVDLWDGPVPPPGVAGIDPGFVGEYIVTRADWAPSPYWECRDWRLLPSSPIANLGVFLSRSAVNNPYLTAANFDPVRPRVFEENVRAELLAFDLDGDGWGNRRVVGGNASWIGVDVGFDEVHSFVMAGSYGNDSFSHNQPTFLNPVAKAGRDLRMVIVPASFVGGAQPVDVKVYATQWPIPLPIPTMPGWSQPPRTLGLPVADSSKPVEYNLRYITFTPPAQQQVSVPMWSFGSPQGLTAFYFPEPTAATGQAPLTFIPIPQVDAETTAQHPQFTGYFNSQVEIQATDGLGRWSNLQWEYR